MEEVRLGDDERENRTWDLPMSLRYIAASTWSISYFREDAYISRPRVDELVIEDVDVDLLFFFGHFSLLGRTWADFVLDEFPRERGIGIPRRGISSAHMSADAAALEPSACVDLWRST